MPQSSLTAWLTKPAAVTQRPQDSVPTDKQKTPLEAEEQLPTPPSSSAEEKHDPDELANAPTVNQRDVAHTKQPWPPHPTLPPNVHIRACIAPDIPAIKRLNSLLLPILYPETFYREILEDPLTNNLTLLATWHDDPSTIGQEKGQLVGAIRCRIVAQPLIPPSPAAANGAEKGAEKPMLYLSTLVLLSPYRSHGIAASMLHTLTVRAIEQYGIGFVGAHVWEANAEGLEWYAKRGFRVVGREEGYYRRLTPSGVVVVRREVRVGDLMGG